MQGACSLLPSLTHKGVHIGVQYVLNSYLNAGGELQLWEEKNESYITKNTSGIATRVILPWTPLHSPNSQNKGSQSWIKKIESVFESFWKGEKTSRKTSRLTIAVVESVKTAKDLAPARSLSIVVGAPSIALSSCRDDLDFYFGTEGNDAVRAIEEHNQMNGLDTKSIKWHCRNAWKQKKHD